VEVEGVGKKDEIDGEGEAGAATFFEGNDVILIRS